MGYVMWMKNDAVSLGSEWLYKLGMQPWIRPDRTFHFFFHKIKDKRESLAKRVLARDDSKTLKVEQNVLRLTPAGWVSGESPSAADKQPHNPSPAGRNRWCRSDWQLHFSRLSAKLPFMATQTTFFPFNLNFWLFSLMKIYLPEQVNTLPCDKWCPSQMEG